MPKRIAGAMALIAFALCLVMGIEAENDFSTTLSRALKALAVTFVVGWLIGTMAQCMLEENLSPPAEKPEKDASKPKVLDR